MDEGGREIAVLGEGWTDIQVFSKGDVIWWWDPVCGENPFEPGKHQWGTRGWEGKGSYTTAKVTAEESDRRKRRRMEEQPTIVPQKVIFDDGEELQFTVYATVESCRG